MVKGKKRQRTFSLKKEYKESWSYIKESKNFIYIVIGIFLVFALIGFFVPAPEYLTEQILRFIEELLEKTSGMSQAELVRFIFLNNIKSSFFGMIFGIFLGIFPVISVISNGYLLGFVSAMIVKTEGALILWRLFPHGIFELPSLFISLGIGLKLGAFIFLKDKKKTFIREIENALRVFLLVVIPLLVIAALIEGSLIVFFP